MTQSTPMWLKLILSIGSVYPSLGACWAKRPLFFFSKKWKAIYFYSNWLFPRMHHILMYNLCTCFSWTHYCHHTLILKTNWLNSLSAILLPVTTATVIKVIWKMVSSIKLQITFDMTRVRSKIKYVLTDVYIWVESIWLARRSLNWQKQLQWRAKTGSQTFREMTHSSSLHRCKLQKTHNTWETYFCSAERLSRTVWHDKQPVVKSGSILFTQHVFYENAEMYGCAFGYGVRLSPTVESTINCVWT